MEIVETKLEGVLILEPTRFSDERGFFMETYNKSRFDAMIGDTEFVQDNHSRSSKGVLRGLHYQINKSQGKLVRAINGSVFDVVVDLRRSSGTFGQWIGVELSEDNMRQLYVPPEFAHGFLALSETVDFLYKVTNWYSPQDERCIRWDDPNIAIEWPFTDTIIVSEKDRAGVMFDDAETFS